MKKSVVLLLFITHAFLVNAQVSKKKNYFPAWSFHKDSINIHGLSVGLWSFGEESRRTNTNGIKLEIIGIGIIIPMIPRSPIAENDTVFKALREDPISERINGFNLSVSGSMCDCITNGVAVGGMAQILYQVNGVSGTIFYNLVQKHNGIMLAMVGNDTYIMNGIQIALSNGSYKAQGVQIGALNYAERLKGIQIGLFNKSKNIKGIQIGLWNVNQKRKMPIVNWG